jgi:hypothetical protein
VMRCRKRGWLGQMRLSGGVEKEVGGGGGGGVDVQWSDFLHSRGILMLLRLTLEATAARRLHREKLQHRRRQQRWMPRSGLELRWGAGQAAAKVVNYVGMDMKCAVCGAFQTTDEFSESATQFAKHSTEMCKTV